MLALSEARARAHYGCSAAAAAAAGDGGAVVRCEDPGRHAKTTTAVHNSSICRIVYDRLTFLWSSLTLHQLDAYETEKHTYVCTYRSIDGDLGRQGRYLGGCAVETPGCHNFQHSLLLAVWPLFLCFFYPVVSGCHTHQSQDRQVGRLDTGCTCNRYIRYLPSGDYIIGLSP